MTIVSHLITHQGRFASMVFDTIYLGRAFRVGLAIGRVDAGEAYLSGIGRAALETLTALQTSESPSATVVIKEIRGATRAREQVLRALRQAPEGAAVFFVCDKDQTNATALKALNIQRVEPPQAPY